MGLRLEGKKDSLLPSGLIRKETDFFLRRHSIGLRRIGGAQLIMWTKLSPGGTSKERRGGGGFLATEEGQWGGVSSQGVV